MKNKLRELLPFLIIVLIIAPSCKKPGSPVTPPVEEKPKLALSVDDTTCIEAWLKLSIENAPLPAGILVKQDGGRARQYTLYQKDTVLYYDSLLPMRNYDYTAILVADTSVNQKLTLRTMDTTSHNYTWQVWELGESEFSVVYDIAIIDKNNIWAVGDFYLRDSLGQPDLHRYNLLKWNGVKWKFERVNFVNSNGDSFLTEINSIFAFSADAIWLSAGELIKWNGSSYQSIEIPNSVFYSSIHEIWANSANNVYVAGSNGSIANYDGVSWKKIDSGTDMNLTDMWGINPSSILIPAKNSTKEKILSLSENKIDSIPWPYRVNIKSVWYDKKNVVFIGSGSGGVIIRTKNRWKQVPNMPNLSVIKIRGAGINNVIGVGGFGFCTHYNGNTWKIYDELLLQYGNYYTCDVKDGIVTMAGFKGDKAIITIGNN